MTTFTTINKVKTITKNNKTVTISKVQKDGTKRTFFKVESEGKLIIRTMYARLYDAEKLAKLYLNN